MKKAAETGRRITASFLVAALAAGLSFSAYATSETREKIKQKEQEREQTQGQLNETKENISGIIDVLRADINRRIADKELELSLTDTARDFITQQAYDSAYGARPLKRYLQKNVETLLAKKILADEVSAGEHLTLDVESRQLLIR